MLPIVLALAQFAPQIAQWIGGSRAEQVAQKVVTIAQTVTDTSTPEQALAAIQANPELAYQFQESIVESQVELQRIAAELEKAHITANIETAKANAADRANARQMALTAQGRIPCDLAYLYTDAPFFVTGAHFWPSFSPIPVKTLGFGVLGNIKSVLIETISDAKKYFLGLFLTAKKQAAVIPASRSGHRCHDSGLNFMVGRNETALPALTWSNL